MYFKKSEDIARNAHLIRCDIDDVTKLDEYLARRNLYCFTLFDVKSNTGLGDCVELLLNVYVRENILREPKARSLCPVHDIGLEIINAKEGKCIDCDDTHLLSDCETEMVYERIGTPATWSNVEPTTTSILDDKTETTWWKSVPFKIACFSVVATAFVGVLNIAVTVFLHFSPVSPPTPVLNSLTATIYITPPSPTSFATATIVSSLTPNAEPSFISEIISTNAVPQLSLTP